MDIRRLQLSTDRYHLTITQSALHCAIDVRLIDNPTGGYIQALKQLNTVTLETLPAEVVFFGVFAKRRPEQIEALTDWLFISAFLARQLDLFFTDRESFGVNITVKAHGVSLVVREADVMEVIG